MKKINLLIVSALSLFFGHMMAMEEKKEITKPARVCLRLPQEQDIDAILALELKDDAGKLKSREEMRAEVEKWRKAASDRWWEARYVVVRAYDNAFIGLGWFYCVHGGYYPAFGFVKKFVNKGYDIEVNKLLLLLCSKQKQD